MITVTYVSPNLAWRQTCSSTPRTRSPSSRAGASPLAAAAAPAPRIPLTDAALDHRPVRPDRLSRRDEPKLVETAEHA